MKVTTVVQNVMVFNTAYKEFWNADVYILDDRIYYVDRKKEGALSAENRIDGTGLYMVPGLIDIHMHIESSMLTPGAFCERLKECGVTTIVSEPHEMANVFGLDGVRTMIAAGEQAPIDIFYGIPSCVPSAGKELETGGGVIDLEAMKLLKEEKSVVCVGEVMSYRQVIQENNLEIGKFLDWLKQNDPDYVIEGHCPALVDLDLAKFLYLGINGDHTEHNIEELKQRFESGMFMEIQGKMLKPDVLSYIEEHQLYEQFGFVTDDVMADDLAEEGQLNVIVKQAIALGMKPEQAIYNATYTNANRMHFYDRGALVPGKLADFFLTDDKEKLTVLASYKRGTCIYQREQVCKSLSDNPADVFPDAYYHSIHCPIAVPEQFTILTDVETGTASVRVMVVRKNSTQTREELVKMPVRNYRLCWEESGCMLAAVTERHGINGSTGYGFVTGDCIKEGAVATTYAHDCHNLLAAGASKEEIARAMNRVIAMNGGYAVVKGKEVLAELPLPIGGILSDQSAVKTGAGLKKVRKAMEDLGYIHNNPVMSFGTLALPVSPALKLTNLGLVDVAAGALTDLIHHID